MKRKKFLNQLNIKLKLKKIPEGNPRLDIENLPKYEPEDGSKFLNELRQVDFEVSESLLSKRNGG
ncbi:MAG: hypothetical protein J7K40_10735 [candidate division Zixibacteria bacterium]|nr:hypothetical protein [candidate division Zixibacteria bacterium]